MTVRSRTASFATLVLVTSLLLIIATADTSGLRASSSSSSARTLVEEPALLQEEEVNDADADVCPEGTTEYYIDFDTLADGVPIAPGTFIDNQWKDDYGGITIFGRRHSSSKDGTFDNENWARLFDSTSPPKSDRDLGSPNKNCPGCANAIVCPGFASRNNIGFLIANITNCISQGNILILHQNGVGDEPNDSVFGGIFELTFDIPISRMISIEFMDIGDDDGPGHAIQLLDSSSNVLATETFEGLGDNTVQNVPLTYNPGTSNIKQVNIEFIKSGAITNLHYCGPHEGTTAADDIDIAGDEDDTVQGSPALSLPSCPSTGAALRTRRTWRSMNCVQRQQFVNAVVALKKLNPDNTLYDGKSLPNFDDFSQIHSATIREAHSFFGMREPRFLPWHRWFMERFETALQIVSNDCSIFLPYWDSEIDAEGLSQDGKTTISEVLSDTGPFGSINDLNLKRGRFCIKDGLPGFDGSWPASEMHGEECLQRIFRPFDLVGEAAVEAAIANTLDYGTFNEEVESTIHAPPHIMIGGHMQTFHSPADPLFFMHHANADRIWALWQDLHEYDLLTTVEDLDNHYETFSVDVPLSYHGSNHSHYFDNPYTGQRPTLRELHHISVTTNPNTLIHVKYVNDLLAKSLTQTSNYETTNNPDWIEIGKDDIRYNCSGTTNAGFGAPRRSLKQEEESTTDSSSLPPAAAAVDDNVVEDEGEVEVVPAPVFFESFMSTRWDELQAQNLRNCKPLPVDDGDDAGSRRKLTRIGTFTDREKNIICDALRPPSDHLNQIRNEYCDVRGNPYHANQEWIERFGIPNLEKFACKRDSPNTIYGTVSIDTNGDDVGDFPQSGATLTLNLIVEDSEPVSSSTTTDETGLYVFPNVTTGLYLVEATIREGQTAQVMVDAKDGKLIETDVVIVE